MIVYGRYTNLAVENPKRGRVPVLNMMFAESVVWDIQAAEIKGDYAILTLRTRGERKIEDD